MFNFCCFQHISIIIIPNLLMQKLGYKSLMSHTVNLEFGPGLHDRGTDLSRSAPRCILLSGRQVSSYIYLNCFCFFTCLFFKIKFPNPSQSSSSYTPKINPINFWLELHCHDFRIQQYSRGHQKTCPCWWPRWGMVGSCEVITDREHSSSKQS